MTGSERVALDQATPDGRWIHRFRGRPDAVLAELARLDAGAAPDGAARVAGAQRLVRALGGSHVDVTLDLRDPETGAVTRSRRRGTSVDTFFALPWLLVRGGGGEARVVRHAHRGLKRSFSLDRVKTVARSFTMDELWVRTSAGVLRRPLRGPAALGAVELLAVEGETPGWSGSLPATAPASASDRGAALGLGVLSAVALLVLFPTLLSRLAGPRGDGLSETLELPDLTPLETREVVSREDRWSRRKGLVAASTSLPFAERLRLLRVVAADRSADLAVRLQAVRMLEGEGDPGATVLVALDGRLAALARARRLAEERIRALHGPEEARRWAILEGRPADDARRVRQAAVRGLCNLGDSRAVTVALWGLEGSSGDDDLRLTWILALAGSTHPAVESALRASLGDSALRVAAQAAWALAVEFPRSFPLLPAAFQRACAASREDADPGGDTYAAVVVLARAMGTAGLGEAAQGELASLSPRLRGSAKRALVESGP